MADEPYKVPTEVHVALVSERTQFLKLMPLDKLASEDIRRLLIDLIEDRVKTRQHIKELREALNEAEVMLDGIRERVAVTLAHAKQALKAPKPEEE